jgi:hypothetical protein
MHNNIAGNKSDMWSSDANADTCIAEFPAEVQKDIASLGSGRGDFEKFCSAFKIIPCPHISFTETSMKIMNCVVDLSNWRAALLAVSTVNSRIREIVVHGCALSKSHVTDISAALEKAGTIITLKLDYITEISGETLPSNFFSPLLMGISFMEYLSLKGNNLTDAFVLDNSKAISENMTIKALSLSNNLISDIGLTELLRILPYSISIKYLSMSQNQIQGNSLEDLAILLTGRGITTEDDTTLKAIAKNVVDRNKALKDLNKKRKKSGLSEFVDLTAPTDRVVKVGTGSLLVNRSMSSIDLSRNQISLDGIKALTELLQEKSQGLKEAGVAESTTQCLVGITEFSTVESITAYQSSDQYNLKIIFNSEVQAIEIAE